jgi:hypothetical protein
MTFGFPQRLRAVQKIYGSLCIVVASAFNSRFDSSVQRQSFLFLRKESGSCLAVAESIMGMTPIEAACPGPPNCGERPGAVRFLLFWLPLTAREDLTRGLMRLGVKSNPT